MQRFFAIVLSIIVTFFGFYLIIILMESGALSKVHRAMPMMIPGMVKLVKKQGTTHPV